METQYTLSTDVLARQSAHSHGKKVAQRSARKEYHCTCCGSKLPSDISEWGLVWESNVHGFCNPCLTSIRKRAKIKPRKKKNSV